MTIKHIKGSRWWHVMYGKTTIASGLTHKQAKQFIKEHSYLEEVGL